MFLITVIGLFVKIPKTLKQTLNPNELIPINSFYISVTKKREKANHSNFINGGM